MILPGPSVDTCSLWRLSGPPVVSVPYLVGLSAGNISAANFYLVDVNDTTVLVNISDPLTAIHRRSKQLTIRDILKNDLKYKIIYYKSGNTGKVRLSSVHAHIHIPH